jgi:hypothetical protein
MDNDTIFFAPFEEHANDVITGVKPIGNRSSLAFDGVGTYVDIGNPGLSSLTSCTVEFWCKTNSVANWLLLRGQDNSKYLMAVTTGSFYHSNAADPVIYRDGEVATTLLRDGNWHHYAAVGINFSTWATATIGGYPSYQIHGSLEDVRLWDRVLTQEEVRALAKKGKLSESMGGLIADWKLNEGQGNLTYDYSPNGYDALIVGGTWKEGRSIHTLGENGVFVEDGTINLFNSPLLKDNASTTIGSSSLTQSKFKIDGQVIEGVTLNQGLSADIIMIQMPHSGVTTPPIFSAYMKSTVINPLKTQVKCVVGGITYWLLNNDTWATGATVEKSNLFSGYTDIGQWQRVSFTIPAFPSGTFESFSFSNGFYRTTNNSTISIANIQLEQKSFTTSFVEGARQKTVLNYNLPVSPNMFTLNFWCKTNGYVANYPFYINLYPNSIIDINNRVYIRPLSGTTIASGRVVAGVVAATPNGAVTDMFNWHMYTLVSNGTTIEIYRNGQLLTSSSSITELTGSSVLLELAGNSGYSNVINQLRVDRVARKPEEILAWYYQGRSG